MSIWKKGSSTLWKSTLLFALHELWLCCMSPLPPSIIFLLSLCSHIKCNTTCRIFYYFSPFSLLYIYYLCSGKSKLMSSCPVKFMERLCHFIDKYLSCWLDAISTVVVVVVTLTDASFFVHPYFQLTGSDGATSNKVLNLSHLALLWKKEHCSLRWNFSLPFPIYLCSVSLTVSYLGLNLSLPLPFSHILQAPTPLCPVHSCCHG